MPDPLPPGTFVAEVPLPSPPIVRTATGVAGFIGFIPGVPAANGGANSNKPPVVFLPTPVADNPKRIQAQRITLPPLQTAQHYTSVAQFIRDYGNLIGDPAADDARKAAQATADASKGRAKAVALAALAQLGPSVLDAAAKVEDFAPNTAKRKTLDAWRSLAHAVRGFFTNGGTRCYVVNAGSAANLQSVLDKQFAGIREITIVAAPGLITGIEQDKLVAHCSNLADRIAILDPQPVGVNDIANAQAIKGIVQDSSYAALYFPNLRVFDPSTQLLQQAQPPQPPNNIPADGGIFLGPCGHVAGVYARVDAKHGVYKSPANEPLLGVLALQYSVSDAVQGQLNPSGINALRLFNGGILVWGARTLGAGNGDFTFISTRRYVNYLHRSLLEGLQWTVFEPNAPALWQRLRGAASNFLFAEWRDGGLLGAKPEQAFFVKCDATTITPAQIAQGIVTIVIGVALLKPSEFILFRIQQRTG